MEKAEKSTTDSSGPANSGSPLVQSAKTIAVKHLKKQLQQLFSGIDDAMFAYGEKSENNEQQMQYFDAMRQIRKDQKSAAQHFLVKFNQFFDDAASGVLQDSGGNDNSNDDFSYASLSLVEEDDLEESLAFTNMVEKSHGLYREQLVAIAQRFHEVIKGVEFNSENNPVSPDFICRAFEQAAEKLSVNLEIKLFVYKLFEKIVVCQLEPMYSAINEMFVTAGILPTIKLKSPVKSDAQQAKPKAQPQPAQAAVPNTTNQVPAINPEQVSFDSLQQLLSVQRGDSGEGSAGGPGGTGGGGFYVADDVLSGLTQLQGDFMSVAAGQLQQASVEEIKNSLLAALSKNQGGDENKGIENNESDVIDIVSMMFEFILEDKTLSDRIRAEIARLQIPVIKVAIIDKQFFDQKKHPARLLLNELAYAGTSRHSQEEGGEDIIYQKVEYVVNRVLSEFETNVDIFAELLEEFKAFVESEIQTAKQSEKLLETTKQKVADEMEKRVKKNKVPKLVYELLLNQWKDVLTRVGMKHNCSGPSWNACLDVIDDLIWSVQPKLMASERQAMTKMIPKLIKRLREGLKAISVDDATVQNYLDQLGTLHLKCLKGADEFMRTDSLKDELEAAMKMNEDEEEEDEGNPFATEEVGDFEYFAGTDDFSMINLTPEVKRSKNYPVVRDLEMGTWMEFKGKDKSKRGKLSWKCDFTGDFTFVDRRYRLVADISMSDLIKRLDQGSAEIVTELPILDRAIDAVINTMTKAIQSANNLVASNS